MLNSRSAIIYIILIVAVTASAYILFVVIPARFAEQSYNGARRIADDLRKALQFTPEVTVNNTIIEQYEKDILELAIVTRTFHHKQEWTHSRMGSTKNITISGSFEAKVGFNLEKKFILEISGDDALLVVPEPELLSLTPKPDIRYEDENGIWNWITSEDRTTALNAFTRDAQQYAAVPTMLTRARSEFERKVKEIFKAHGKTVRVQYAVGLAPKQ